jgi:hypothetical protein
MTKNVFATFASSDFSEALKRIEEQAHKMLIFDQVIAVDETVLAPAFRKEFFQKLTLGSRGFGYWCWKPQFIRQVMDDLEYGSNILYADAGCHLNPEGVVRLKEYFGMLSDDTPLVAFQQDPTNRMFNEPNRDIPDWPLRNWTKGDLIDHFGARDREDILSAQTHYATAFLIQKTPQAEVFLDSWIDTFRNNWSLIDDSPSLSPNEPSFVEHRHDQAIFSLLCHQFPVISLSGCELWCPHDWMKLEDYPVHAKRDRGKKVKFQRRKAKFKKLLKKLTGQPT